MSASAHGAALVCVPWIGERVGAELDMEGYRKGALDAFLEPRRPVAVRHPSSTPAPFPFGIGVVDEAVQARGTTAQRVGNAQHHQFAVLQRQRCVVFVAGRDRHVRPKPQGIVLIDPGVMAGRLNWSRGRINRISRIVAEPGMRRFSIVARSACRVLWTTFTNRCGADCVSAA